MEAHGGEILFRGTGISKFFGPTVALDQVDIEVRRGEIMGFIGENGSGKSTMSSIAAGIQRPDKGTMEFLGQPYAPATMIEGLASGVGMIVQESGVVTEITVAENIFLGEEKRFRKGPFIDRRAMNREASEALATIGFTDVSPAAPISNLDLQQRKLVEVAKVMHAHPQLLIVDETTTALSQQGRDILYDCMRKLRAENKSVLFISHDLQELMDICDRLTVLRDGKLIATVAQSDFDEDEIKRYMVGREVSRHYYREDYGKAISDEVVLSVRDLTTGYGLLKQFDLELHKGELVGIGGLSHCGMHELSKAVFGDTQVLSGEVVHVPSGDRITSPIVAMKHGMGYVSKDRDKEALVLSASIRDNIVSAGLDKLSNRLGLIHPGKEKAYVQDQIDALSIKCENMSKAVQYLSGGNKQKVVFGKWVGRKSDILILDCPTRGVDIGVKAAMYQLMEDMLASGCSILLISEELTELIGMSDRIIILKDGEVSGSFDRSPDLTEGEIIHAMI
ncbi:MAG: sugar ABC transporter ATP-binding protein [Oscillospiraceae bacterium]|nr:sugar ABC transporter ATP-binding protein [Oscillospiraceae bacterium]